jgi:hypothetical protein
MLELKRIPNYENFLNFRIIESNRQTLFPVLGKAILYKEVRFRANISKQLII